MRRLTTGRLVTMSVILSQNPSRDVSAPFSENLVRKGIVSVSMRGPRRARTAGRRVRVAASETITTMIAPSASDW